MKVSYYPGCTLKNAAQNFEESTFFSLNHLGVEVEELAKWYCCGTVFSLATDDLIHHLGPVRNLIRVKEAGADSVMTLCAMCYNTLKRVNERVKADPESLEKINEFMSREELTYQGDVKIFHLLELLRDEISFAEIKEKISRPLKNLKVANYYGCMLVRPPDIGLDDMENPTILEEFTSLMGADPVDFPYKTECCGAYQTVDNPEIIIERTQRILSSAVERGADVVTVSCPLCAFNLDHRQRETAQKHTGFKHIPILYFTQLLALALGGNLDALRLDLHHIDPTPVLKAKNLI